MEYEFNDNSYAASNLINVGAIKNIFVKVPSH